MTSLNAYNGAVSKAVGYGFMAMILSVLTSVLLGFLYMYAGLAGAKVHEYFWWPDLFSAGGFGLARTARFMIVYSFFSIYVFMMMELQEKLSPYKYLLILFVIAPVVFGVFPFAITTDDFHVSSYWSLLAITGGIILMGWHKLTKVYGFTVVIILLYLIGNQYSMLIGFEKAIEPIATKLGVNYSLVPAYFVSALDMAIEFYFIYLLPKRVIDGMRKLRG